MFIMFFSKYFFLYNIVSNSRNKVNETTHLLGIFYLFKIYFTLSFKNDMMLNRRKGCPQVWHGAWHLKGGFMVNRFFTLHDFFHKKYGERVLKICVNGGFTCPNRDGTCGIGGCIFCGEKGSGEHLNFEYDIPSQIQNYFASYKAQRANKFIVYFQNFSNTYDTLENLKAKYDSALIDDRIVGISIATRPDCINEKIVKLLKSYTEKYYVMVELGLQTANDETAKIIHRGYPTSTFTKAVELLNKYKIDVITHVMVGLPNETMKDIQNTVFFLNNHNIQGLKIHSTYVIQGTVLSEMYQEGKYTPLTLKQYIDSVSYILTHISPQVVIHRISGDAPKEKLLAPDWNLHKKWILNGIHQKLEKDDLWQGKFFNSENFEIPHIC